MRRLAALLLVGLSLAGCELGLPEGPVDEGQGVISGTITDTANTMVANATISVRGAASRNVVAAAGVYSVRDLPAGNYSVTVVPPQGYEVAPNTNGMVPIQIVGSETKVVNFKVRRSP
jgi:hypothetical protein